MDKHILVRLNSEKKGLINGIGFFYRRIVLIFVCSCFIFSSLGCEAFVKKFTRKTKKKKTEEQMVLVPQEYSVDDVSVKEKYQQGFLYWSSWHDEFIASLETAAGYKRRVYCLEETIKNLQKIRPLMFEEKQKDLDVYLDNLYQLKEEVVSDHYGMNILMHKKKAEKFKRGILKDFSFSKVEGHLR